MKQDPRESRVETAGKTRLVHARSLHSSRPFNVAAVFSALHYLGIAVTLTALVLIFTDPSLLARDVFIGGIAFSVVTWLISFFKRRSAHCPLCKGTPMINSGALAHSRASRIFPFNHGVTATLSIITTQSFRCMYCGSDFDMLKTPSNRRENASANLDAPFKFPSARHGAWPSSRRLPAPISSISRHRR
jgi:hypothetical protein